MQIRPNKNEPDFADHSYSRPQARGRTPRMRFQKFLYVLFYHRRKLLDFNGGHINRNARRTPAGLKKIKSTGPTNQ